MVRIGSAAVSASLQRRRSSLRQSICNLEVWLQIFLVVSFGCMVLSALYNTDDDTATTAGSLATATSNGAVIPGMSANQRQHENTLPNLKDLPKPEITVAYVVVLTGCTPNREGVDVFPLAEAGAVLQYSAQRAAAVHGNRYGVHFYALYHPQAKECAETLKQLKDFTVLERDTPVPVSEIQGDFLRERIVKNGCCGEKELIKFEAFTLTDHELVVLLDIDALILQPLDPLFDLLLHRKVPDTSQQLLMWPEEPLPPSIEVLHTIDYAMINPPRFPKPFQGGFAIIKPNRTLYQDFCSIIRKGDFRESGGWGGISGKFWGGQTFQGLMPYYFHQLHSKQRSVELNWCTINNMASPSRTEGVVNDKANGACYNNQKTCEDCRERSFESVVSTHFTVCQKPWTCQSQKRDMLQERLCRKFHHAWFQARNELERSSLGRSGVGDGSFDREHFFGNCNRHGTKGYIPMRPPYA